MTRVLIVDDSMIARDVLSDLIEEDGDLRVIGTAADGEAAVSAVAGLAPDVVTMDIQMPGGDGLTAIEQIMARNPVPIVVVSARARDDQTLPFEAISRGALEVAVKPSMPGDAAALRAAIRRVAGIPVIPHVRALRTARSMPPPPVFYYPNRPRVVGLGSSAGGPAALDVVLGALPANLPACVAIVQHLPPGFVASFATYLRSRTPLEVVLAEPGASVEARAGRLVLAAGDHHLVATSPRLLSAIPDPPWRGHRPSVSVLFSSLARQLGDRAVGVILTGIGDDGASGLAEMRARGAMTMAQDEKTSVVYGMPSAAVKLGAAVRVLPLQDIAAAIRNAVEGPAGGHP
jgi:two-component system, chemotaxis family, protein-glutamate methylesterase/glutaminase